MKRTKKDFKLQSPYPKSKDQKVAIEQLLEGTEKGGNQTLLGVTGSGKTFVMANIIAKENRPTLILSHNKTLAAQLYEELKEFFPEKSTSSKIYPLLTYKAKFEKNDEVGVRCVFAKDEDGKYRIFYLRMDPYQDLFY